MLALSLCNSHEHRRVLSWGQRRSEFVTGRCLGSLEHQDGVEDLESRAELYAQDLHQVGLGEQQERLAVNLLEGTDIFMRHIHVEAGKSAESRASRRVQFRNTFKHEDLSAIICKALDVSRNDENNPVIEAQLKIHQKLIWRNRRSPWNFLGLDDLLNLMFWWISNPETDMQKLVHQKTS